ncbi:unnamed protein product [Citrullus colocynthis]|uniref:Uncharacterized protein n=1 Tax=Citrullus colocynthis TaxID=252529 RepID=A0ABP0YNK4_9ROSI
MIILRELTKAGSHILVTTEYLFYLSVFLVVIASFIPLYTLHLLFKDQCADHFFINKMHHFVINPCYRSSMVDLSSGTQSSMATIASGNSIKIIDPRSKIAAVKLDEGNFLSWKL